MSQAKTAILLIGFQNDYFAADGVLHGVIEANASSRGVLQRTLALLERERDTDKPIINLPILFSPDYSELREPTGLMAKIRDVGAFRRDSSGGAVSPEIAAFGSRIENVIGKTGFNAFHGTDLHQRLQELGVEEVVLCGVVTSVCIDSTGRAANELGYRVTILSDCTAGRSDMEHDFYCEDVFPLYASVVRSDDAVSDAAA